MRPIRLEVEGLTSFRQKVEIDFSAFDQFAITGPTGAGKTSIIDAIIYALYGRTPRLGSRSIRELISQGANRLTVLLEFSCGTDRYRIARELQRKPRRIEVRLEVYEGDRWVFRSDRAADAEQFIERTIGLDYKGFTKAVVLPQGEFDAFLKGETDDRRKILSRLLELDVYTRMMSRANERAKEHKTEAEVRERQLAKDFADAMPETLGRLESEVGQLRPQLEPLDLDLARIRASLPRALQLRQHRTEVVAATAELEKVQPRITVADEQVREIALAVASTQESLSELETRLQANLYNASLHLELSAILPRAQRMAEQGREEEKRRHAAAIKENEVADLQSALETAQRVAAEAKTARDAQQLELDDMRVTLDESLRNHGSPDALKELIGINQRRIADEQKRIRLQLSMEEMVARRGARSEELKRIAEQIVGAEQNRRRRKDELDVLRHRHAAEELRRALEPGALCPVCEFPVARVPNARAHPSIEDAMNEVELCENLVKELERNNSTIESELLHLEPQVADRREQIDELDSTISDAGLRLSAVLGKAPGLDAEAELNRLRESAQRLKDELDERNRRLESLKDDEIKAARSAQEQQSRVEVVTSELASLSAEIARLADEIANLRADLGEHTDVESIERGLQEQERARLEREDLLRSKEEQTANLSRSKDQQTSAVGALEQLKGRAATLDKTREEAQERIRELESSLSAIFPELNVTEGAPDADAAWRLEIRAVELQSERNRLSSDITRYEHQIEDLIARIKRAAEVRQEMERHREEGDTARTLAHALQSNQFLAFVQQEAFQRLAADGSRHLNTLSSERYAFAAEGDDFMIVDHWNADELRPINTLSGGEMFLASVALALALAEGLAGLSHGRGRFALESLFLDEGFGTLDAETLDVVLQGVENLSTGDRLVGIVSHIPELAERMPSRIHVRKSVGGSTIEIS